MNDINRKCVNYKVNPINHSFYRKTAINNHSKENINNDRNDCIRLSEHGVRNNCHVH